MRASASLLCEQKQESTSQVFAFKSTVMSQIQCARPAAATVGQPDELAGTTQLPKSQLELLGLLLAPSQFSKLHFIQCCHITDCACALQLLMNR